MGRVGAVDHLDTYLPHILFAFVQQRLQCEVCCSTNRVKCTPLRGLSPLVWLLAIEQHFAKLKLIDWQFYRSYDPPSLQGA